MSFELSCRLATVTTAGVEAGERAVTKIVDLPPNTSNLPPLTQNSKLKTQN